MLFLYKNQPDGKVVLVVPLVARVLKSCVYGADKLIEAEQVWAFALEYDQQHIINAASNADLVIVKNNLIVSFPL
jgi:hypothetical protein